MRRRHAVIVAAAAVLSCASAASAQVAGAPTGAAAVPQIDPGLILRQNRSNERNLEQQTQPQLSGPAVVAPSILPQKIAAPGGPTVLLRSVVFDPSKFLTKAQLDAIAARYVGRRVDISDIQKLVKAVNDLFVAKGVVTATAYLPPQKLNTGQLHVGIVEGKLDKVQVKGNVALTPEFVRQEFGGTPGAVVDVDDVSDRVARINKTGNAQVQAYLQPGSQFGLTDIQLAVTEPAINSLNLFVDNEGVPSVGPLETGLLYQRYGLLGIDDKFTFYAVRSSGDIAFNSAYNIAVNDSGGRVGVSISRGAIKVVQGPFQPLDITGDSTIGAVNASQPIFVNQHWLLLANAAASYYQSISDQFGVPITHNDTYRGTVGLTVGYTGSTVSATFAPTYSRGHTEFDVTQSQQDFNLLDATYSASVQLPASFYIYFNGAAQFTTASVLPGDQLFQIGGPTAVRGYATDLLAGPTGWYGDFELHRGLDFITSDLSAFGFFDTGAVYNVAPKVVHVDAVGVGVAWDIHKKVLAELTAGFPLTKPVGTSISPYQLFARVTAKF